MEEEGFLIFHHFYVELPVQSIENNLWPQEGAAALVMAVISSSVPNGFYSVYWQYICCVCL